jgi:hypothetical protein
MLVFGYHQHLSLYVLCFQEIYVYLNILGSKRVFLELV